MDKLGFNIDPVGGLLDEELDGILLLLGLDLFSQSQGLNGLLDFFTGPSWNGSDLNLFLAGKQFRVGLGDRHSDDPEMKHG